MSIIKKFNYKNKKGKRSIISVFVISENEYYITGIKLDNLPDTDIKLIKERFKNRQPDNEIKFREERRQKLKKISGMKKRWINASATFKKSKSKQNNKTYKNKTKKTQIKRLEKKAKQKKKKEKYIEAIECYNEILRLKPAYPEYYQKKIDRLKNKIKEKEEEIKRQVEKIKKQAEEWYEKALRHAQIEQYEDAIDCCRKAIELQPNNKKYQNEIPKLEIKLKKRNEEEIKDKERIKSIRNGTWRT